MNGGAVQVWIKPDPVFLGVCLHQVVDIDLDGIMGWEAVGCGCGGGVHAGVGGRGERGGDTVDHISVWV